MAYESRALGLLWAAGWNLYGANERVRSLSVENRDEGPARFAGPRASSISDNRDHAPVDILLCQKSVLAAANDDQEGMWVGYEPGCIRSEGKCVL